MPQPPGFEKLPDLFAEAVGLPSDERMAFIDKACGSNAALRAQLLRLLAHDVTDDGGLVGAPQMVFEPKPEPASVSHAPEPKPAAPVGPARSVGLVTLGVFGLLLVSLGFNAYLAQQGGQARRALQQAEVLQGETRQRLAEMENARGMYLELVRNAWSDAGGPEETETLVTRIRSEWPPDHPERGGLLRMLGETLVQREQMRAAEPLLAEALELDRRHFGESGAETLHTTDLYARCLATRGAFEVAEPLLETLLDHATPEAQYSLLLRLGNAAIGLEAWQRAEKRFRGALALGQAEPQPGYRVVTAWYKLAEALRGQGRSHEVVGELEQALETVEGRWGAEDPHASHLLDALGFAYLDAGRLADAERVWQRLLASDRTRHGERHADVARDTARLGLVRQRMGQLPQAARLTREALELNRELLPLAHPQTLGAMVQLASILEEQALLNEAEDLLRAHLEVRRRAGGRQHHATRRAAGRLADMLIAAQRWQAATEVLRELIRVCEEAERPDEVTHWRARLQVVEDQLAG